MRQLNLPYNPYRGRGTSTTGDTLTLLSYNSPGGVLLPNLERLIWDISDMPPLLAFFRLFLSPRLKHLILCANLDPYLDSIPPDVLEELIKMISFLPASLESVVVSCGKGEEDSLQDAISSFVCRCGPSLRSFETYVPLSNTAIVHLMTLPNLSSLSISQGPPQAVPKLIFPSLEHLRLPKSETSLRRGSDGPNPEASQWLELLIPHTNDILQNDSGLGVSSTYTIDLLKTLEYTGNAVIDSELLSSITRFRNLVTLSVPAVCSTKPNGCTFHLTDDDRKNLATTLPRLKCLRLGFPCPSDTCRTTVASLMSISVHCLDLTVLETHFNIETMAGDMQRLLDERSGEDKAKCKIWYLLVGKLPLHKVYRCREDSKTIQLWFRFIFPNLRVLLPGRKCLTV
jgi:hypothetical protein